MADLRISPALFQALDSLGHDGTIDERELAALSQVALMGGLDPDEQAVLEALRDGTAFRAVDRESGAAREWSPQSVAFPNDSARSRRGGHLPALAADASGTANRPMSSGLRPTPWFEGTFLPGSSGDLTPIVVGARDAEGVAAGGASSYTQQEMLGLAGQSFDALSQSLRTPADVAYYLDRNVAYDMDRASGGTDNTAWSSNTVLQNAGGVCRDQHALARDLLQAQGYDAVLVGFAAPDQPHAITAYRDPATGYWGVIEYGTLYPPDQVRARSAIDAIMRVRPETWYLATYSDGSPGESSHAVRHDYSPASRVMSDVMAGPSATAGSGVTVTNQAVTGSLALGQTQLAVTGVLDPRLPHLQGTVVAGAWHTSRDGAWRIGGGLGFMPNMQSHEVGTNAINRQPIGFGFVSFEERHRGGWENIGGSGFSLTASSYTRIQGSVAVSNSLLRRSDPEASEATPTWGVDVPTLAGLSGARWNPELTASQSLDLWGHGGEDTRLFATMGAGLDAFMLVNHYISGGQSFPINTYTSFGVETSPSRFVTLSAQGYVPITNVTNDFAAHPLGRFGAAVPLGSVGQVSVGTTQGIDQARYESNLSFQVSRAVSVGGQVRLDEDRITDQTQVVGGLNLTVR